MAYLIDKAFWRQGLGLEAAQACAGYGFKTLGLTRLICMIYPENVASINVARRLGMTLEKEMEDEFGPYLIYSRNLPPA